MFSKCQTSVVFGDTGKKGSYETTSGANIAAYTGGQILRPDGKDLRKSNISLGTSGGAFETTAQTSFKSLTTEEVKNTQAERGGVDVRASVLTIGKGKHETAPQSVSAANYGAIDTAKYSPERVRKKDGKTSISMGKVSRDWSTTGKMATPDKGAEYRVTAKTKGAMAKTNWNAGNYKVDYVSQTAASTSQANSPIKRTQLAEPAKGKNVTLGSYRGTYETEGKSSFKDTKITTAKLQGDRKTMQSMKTKVRQSNVTMGGGKTVYTTSSKDSLFDPRGDVAAYKVQSKIDPIKQNKTNFVVGYSGPQFETEVRSTVFNTNKGNSAKLTSVAGKQRQQQVKYNKFTDQIRSQRKVPNLRKIVSSSRAVTVDEKALYGVKYQKHGGAELRNTNFTLGTQKQNYASEAGATFQNHGVTVYAAAKGGANKGKNTSKSVSGQTSVFFAVDCA